MKINNTTPNVNTNDGSSTPTKNNNIAFKGINPTKELNELFTLDKKGPMSRHLFIVNAFAFLLGTRLITSRDKDERRETMIRDIPTIVISVMGVPLASKLIAKRIENRSGFALMKDAGEKGDITKWFEKNILRRKDSEIKNGTDVASYNELKGWYTYDNKLASGFEGFTKRLDDLNGNLNKIFSSLGSKFKEELKNKEFSEKDNKEFMVKLFKKDAKGNYKNSELIQKLQKAFSSDKNVALQKALFKKTITKIFGFASTIAIAGLCIPKANIAITEALHKGQKKKPTEQKSEKA